MPVAGEDVLNGPQINGGHVDNTTKLRFDTIEDTIKAFSKFLCALSAAFLLHQVMSIFTYLVGNIQAERAHIAHYQAVLLTNIIFLLENGEFIIVLDSTDRENEGDLIIAAEAVTTEQMAFMIRHTR